MRLKRELVPGDHLLDLEGIAGSLDLTRVFGASGPFELEIGSGKGTYLAQEARVRPDACFLGVEWMKKYALYAADRLRRAGLSNTRMIAGDALEFIRELAPTASFAAVHIYFPDPWPKARHHKRRSVRSDTLPLFESLLMPGGVLRIVTDHPEYAEWIEAVLTESSLTPEAYQPTASAREGELVGTNFERKYKLRDGRPSFPFQLRKSKES